MRMRRVTFQVVGVLTCLVVLLWIWNISASSIMRMATIKYSHGTHNDTNNIFPHEKIIRELNSIAEKLNITLANDKQLPEIYGKLNQVIEILKIRQSSSRHKPTPATTVKPHNSTKKVIKSSVPTTTIEEVCPDKFIGYDYADPFFLNGSWVRQSQCKREQPLSNLITIVLLRRNEDKGECSSETISLLDTITNLFPDVLVIVGTDSDYCVEADNVHSVTFSRRPKIAEGKAWNMLLQLVTTPYALIGRNLELFSWFAQVKRLIRVVGENSTIAVAGGSIRNTTGHWQVGCYQMETRMYKIRYKEGYYASQYECMFCDHLAGPFVLRMSLFKRLNFDEELHEASIFHDFFYRLKLQHMRSMICPDAMHFVKNFDFHDSVVGKEKWFRFANKWKFSEIYLPSGVTHEFTCKELGLICRGLLQTSGKSGMPLCCKGQLVDALKMIHKISVDGRHFYYINGGTLLGAIKFNDIIPWDFDGDVVYYFSDFSAFKKFSNKFKTKKGIYFDEFHKKHPGYFQVKTPDIAVEMAAYNKTNIDVCGMTDYFKKNPTLVKIRDTWVWGPPSPGLYIRNMYGKEYLRHSNGWWNKGHLWNDPYKEQKHFYKCGKQHHSCNDNYPSDGSLPFLLP